MDRGGQMNNLMKIILWMIVFIICGIGIKFLIDSVGGI